MSVRVQSEGQVRTNVLSPGSHIVHEMFVKIKKSTARCTLSLPAVKYGCKAIDLTRHRLTAVVVEDDLDPHTGWPAFECASFTDEHGSRWVKIKWTQERQ